MIRKLKAGLAFLLSGILSTSIIPVSSAYADNINKINVTIDTTSENARISPYIYGANYDSDGNEGTIPKVATASRLGGNRLTGYNWENNASNAGSDWVNSSDNYLNMNKPYEVQNIPGRVVTDYQDEILKNGSEYSLVTLQMAGYVAKDKNGTVTEQEVAPSSRWVQVKAKKGSTLSLQPDLNDDAVYMDEFINAMISKYGKSDSATGIKGYSLDNEPTLWTSTHSRIHKDKVTCEEIISKSTDYSKMVKELDSNAEVFGPALFGMGAFLNFNTAPDWENVKGNYKWFPDYYLDQMKKASDKEGKRLIDVFDIHYYSEARGGDARVTEGSDTNIECNKARIQAPRTLWDPSYTENSWIGQWFSDYTPIIPKMFNSINKYYPGTKLGITEYNFGGNNHISGGIAQVDMLGIFSKYNVYYGAMWPFSGKNNYLQSAFNLYRNYDGKKSTYGDIKVKAETSDIENSSVYASLDSKDDSKLHIIMINKNYDKPMTINFNLGGNKVYKSGKVWAFDKNSSEITERASINNIVSNKFEYTIPELTTCHIILDVDKDAGQVPVDPDDSKPTSEFVTTDGNKFKVDGHDFYFAGTNNYYLPYAPQYMVDDVFDDAKAMGLKVMRTWGFIDGEKSNNVVLQPSLGVYDEEGFKKFDYVVKKAKESGIKLVIPFVNNWDDFGGMNQYIKWCGASKHDDFYTNEACKTAYKNYINYFVNRVNSYTGVKYKDDPTIMTWELGNEPRCQSDSSGQTLYNWTKEMSSYIKSLDSKHLVALGDEGFFRRTRDDSDWNYTGGEGVDWDRIIEIPTIDYGTYHLYPDGWNRSADWGTQWIKDHIEATNTANKPSVLEEYGIKNNRESVYKTWSSTLIDNGGAGIMHWILTGVGFDGSSLYPDYDGFRVTYPSSVADIIIDDAAKMNKKSESNPIVLGDVNNDGIVNISDYIALQKYVVGEPNNINVSNGDLNKDGKINTSDLFLLRINILS